jgi:DHA2 family multidrug resistance protein
MAEQVAADRALVQVSNPLLVMISVITMGLCVYLDQTIANVALPHMRASLGASPETISWVLTSFIIATAITAPITGWMVDKLGSRMVYLGASALFLASSAACGAASSLSALVLFRMLQGVATGFIAPMTQMILFDISKPSEQAFMTSTYSAVAMVVPVSGPFVGAFLTDYLSWRWCFFINLVVGLPALVALAARLPTRPRQHRPLDVTGYASLAIAVGAFQMMLDRGQGNGWFDSTETIVEAVLAGGALWVFVVHSFFAERPLFPRALMRDSNFVAGCLQMMAIGMTVTTVAAILPTMLQTVMGWPVVFTGEAVAPRGFGTLVSTVLNGWLMRKIELRVLIAVGFAISAASTATMTSWSLQLHSNIMFWALLVQGIGMGLVFAPLNLIAFGGLETKYRPDGASLRRADRAHPADQPCRTGDACNRDDRPRPLCGADAGGRAGAEDDRRRDQPAGDDDRLPRLLQGGRDRHAGDGAGPVFPQAAEAPRGRGRASRARIGAPFSLVRQAWNTRRERFTRA